MEYHHSMSTSSSPPLYTDFSFSPASSQERPNQENTPEERVRKRRRIEAQNTISRTMANPSRLPPIPALPTSWTNDPDFMSQFTFPPSLTPASTRMPVERPWLEEEAALEYLSSDTGFAQDLRDVNDLYMADFQSIGIPTPASSAAVPPTAHASNSGYPPVIPGSLLPLEEEFFQLPLPPTPPIPPTAQAAGTRHVDRLSSAAARPVFATDPVPPMWAFAEPLGSAASPRRPPILPDASRPPRRNYSSVGESSKKPQTTLTLSRASERTIEALDEHKRECPLCCLDFEPNNYMAEVSCCHTVMHAKCLSAWVNCDQQNPRNHHKAKICLKCRREVDIKHHLNEVIPRVSEKDWDEGYDFNAPESLQGSDKKELNITARPHRAASTAHRHRQLAAYASFRAEQRLASLSTEQKASLGEIREGFEAQAAVLKQRRDAARERSHWANHDDLEASRLLVESQTHATEAEMTAMLKTCRETKVVRDRARSDYERVSAECDELRRSQANQLTEILESFHDVRSVERSRIRREGEASSSSAAQAPLRVANPDAPSLSSSFESNGS